MSSIDRKFVFIAAIAAGILANKIYSRLSEYKNTPEFVIDRIANEADDAKYMTMMGRYHLDTTAIQRGLEALTSVDAKWCAHKEFTLKAARDNGLSENAARARFGELRGEIADARNVAYQPCSDSTAQRQ